MSLADTATMAPVRRVLFMAVALTSLFAASSSLAADEFCEQVKSFDRKPLATLPDGELQRRWIDFSWGTATDLKENEVQLGFTLKCVGSDEAAKTLCQYLIHHTPHENLSAVPIGILRCEGFAAGRAAFPGRWVEELSWDGPNDLVEIFQIDQLDREGHEPTMRLTMMAYPESPQAKKPAPFFKALWDKLGLEDHELD